MRISDWSSDVCSSDLARLAEAAPSEEQPHAPVASGRPLVAAPPEIPVGPPFLGLFVAQPPQPCVEIPGRSLRPIDRALQNPSSPSSSAPDARSSCTDRKSTRLNSSH